MDSIDEFLNNLDKGDEDLAEENDSRIIIVKQSSLDYAASDMRFWIGYKVIGQVFDGNSYETRVSREHSGWVVHEFRDDCLEDGLRLTERPLLFDEAREIACESAMNYITDLFVVSKIGTKKTDIKSLMEDNLPLSPYEREMVLSGGRNN